MNGLPPISRPPQRCGPRAPNADVTIYTPHEDKELMFQLPRYVIKAGEVLIEDGPAASSPTTKC